MDELQQCNCGGDEFICAKCGVHQYKFNQMKLLRMDFITYTNKVEHEVKMVKKELRTIKESLRTMIKMRPDQTVLHEIRELKENLRRKK